MTARPKLLIASNNPGKVQEFRDLLGGRVDIVTMSDLGLESPEETEDSFAGNATLKARYLHDRTGEVTLADDSGLQVDALDGRPGVISARYAGEPPDDAANRALVLKQMEGIAQAKRTARFVASIALVDRSGAIQLVEGLCEGSIGFKEQGTNGFGYDSIFMLPEGRTMAELTPLAKNEVSHRGNALRQLLPALETTLGLS